MVFMQKLKCLLVKDKENVHYMEEYGWNLKTLYYMKWGSYSCEVAKSVKAIERKHKMLVIGDLHGNVRVA